MAYETASVIVNPQAGRHDPERSARSILEGLEKAGIAGTLHTTEQASDTPRFAAEAVAEGVDLVVVAGGDGTIMGALGSLANTGVPLLPLPLGTWNGLVRMLGAPMQLEEALALCLEGDSVHIDIGYIPEIDRYFLLWAGAGIDAEVMAGVEKNGMKKRWGYWAYIGALAERLGGSRNRSLTLELDGVTHAFDGHTILAFNVNDLRFAGLQIGPKVDPHDGKMDLTVLTRAGFWGTLQEMTGVLTSGSSNNAKGDRSWLVGSRARIDAQPPLDVQADGEVVGKTPLTLEIMHRALAVQAPQGYSGGLATGKQN